MKQVQVRGEIRSLETLVGELNFQLGSPSDCEEIRAIAGRCEVVGGKIQHADALKDAYQKLGDQFDEVISKTLIAHISKIITAAVDRATSDDIVKDELQALRNLDFMCAHPLSNAKSHIVRVTSPMYFKISSVV